MAKNTKQIVTIEDFSVTNLKEFQGKKESQELLVKENPFIEITDNESYEKAKKHRTALVSARTSLEKEKKSVTKRVKEVILEPVSVAYDELIGISSPHENKQQLEVKRYEAKKEEERLEKQRLEKERVDKILQKIDVISYSISQEIQSLTYEESLSYEIRPMYEGNEVNEEEFDEYASKYLSELEALKFELEQRKSILNQQEENRLEAIKLEKIRIEQERIDLLKAAIYNFNSKWQHLITNLQENNIDKVVSEFNNIKDQDFQEFQSDYETTKQQVGLALNNRIAQINQQIELEKQKREINIVKNKGKLASIGFDFNTLTYIENDFEYSFTEADLDCNEEMFESLLNIFKQNLFDYKESLKPKQEIIQPQVIAQPPVNMTTFQVQPTPQETISEPTFNEKQLRSIEFLKTFVSYCEQNIGTPTDANIRNFVLINVK